MEIQQIAHVVQRVVELLPGQRAPGPVAQAEGLLRLDPAGIQKQVVKAALFAVPQKGRSDLGVEDVLEDSPEGSASGRRYRSWRNASPS